MVGHRGTQDQGRTRIVNQPVPQSPVSRESGVATVFVGIQYENGAVRHFTAQKPLGFALAVDEGANEASLGGLASEDRREPRIMVTFEGNPDAGGVEGFMKGTPP